MLEALCRQSSTTLDIMHAEDGPPITQRTSGLVDQEMARLMFCEVSDHGVEARDLAGIHPLMIRLSIVRQRQKMAMFSG